MNAALSNDIVLIDYKVLFNIYIKYDLPTFSCDSHPPTSNSTNLTVFIFVNVFENGH